MIWSSVSLHFVHKMGIRAEKRIYKELLEDLQRVNGKTQILFRIAEVALNQPDASVKEVIYPIASEQTLRDLVAEYRSSGPAYRIHVHTIMRRSYSSHYRRMLPQLLEVLEIRTNNVVQQPVIEALEVLRKYIGTSHRYYPPDETVPIEGVVRPSLLPVVIESTQKGEQRIIKKEISQKWPMISLLDILKETDLRVGFTNHLTNIGERSILPRDILQKRLLLCLYGLGTNMGLKRVSNATSKGSSEQYPDLQYVSQRYLTPDTLRLAIVAVVNETLRIRQSHIWGEGTTAVASDARKFAARDQNLLTEWHVRYHGPGVMVYWHVERHSTCIYSQLKSCSSSEVAAMIEGVLRHCTEMEVEKNYVDSHGQSEVGFAFCHLLGFKLLPRLRAISRQRLYRPDKGQPFAYPNLMPILTRPINWGLILSNYDEMVKYATALRLGTAEADAILRRFTRNRPQHPTYRALAELGKVVKTIFLCDYLAEQDLRREIHQGLNVVETWNSVNDFILYAKGSEFASNQSEIQELTMLSLHLLQVSLVYVNTLMIQQVLAEPNWRGLNPLIHNHVNPYGTFELDLSKRLPIKEKIRQRTLNEHRRRRKLNNWQSISDERVQIMLTSRNCFTTCVKS